MTDLVVLHDLGDPDGGSAWRAAGAVWDGDVIAPDLPGHGDTPPPVGGHHDHGDAVFTVAPLLAERTGPPPLVVGIGLNGHVAQVLALGGRSVGLVLVDGLGGPWFDVAARSAALREHRRSILATPAALDPPPPRGLDPRAALGAPPRADLDFALDMARAMPVPTLLVESPASLAGAEVPAAFPDAVLHRVAAIDPPSVLDLITSWWSTRV